MYKSNIRYIKKVIDIKKKLFKTPSSGRLSLILDHRPIPNVNMTYFPVDFFCTFGFFSHRYTQTTHTWPASSPRAAGEVVHPAPRVTPICAEPTSNWFRTRQGEQTLWEGETMTSGTRRCAVAAESCTHTPHKPLWGRIYNNIFIRVFIVKTSLTRSQDCGIIQVHLGTANPVDHVWYHRPVRAVEFFEKQQDD